MGTAGAPGPGAECVPDESRQHKARSSDQLPPTRTRLHQAFQNMEQMLWKISLVFTNFAFFFPLFLQGFLNGTICAAAVRARRAQPGALAPAKQPTPAAPPHCRPRTDVLHQQMSCW